jgi:hypothetical protein
LPCPRRERGRERWEEREEVSGGKAAAGRRRHGLSLAGRGTPSPHSERSREMGRGVCFCLEQKLCVYIRFLRFGAKVGGGRKRLRRSRLSGREAGGAGVRRFGFKRSEPHETRSDGERHFGRRGRCSCPRIMSGLLGLISNATIATCQTSPFHSSLAS